MNYIKVDSENKKIYKKDGNFLCDYKYEEIPEYDDKGNVISLSSKTGRIILYLGDSVQKLDNWADVESYLVKNGGEQLSLFEEEKDQVKISGFQCGDQIKIKTDDKMLSKILNTTKDKIKRKATVKVPNAPDDMLGVMIDGKYILIDKEDAEIIYEGFSELREMKYFKSSSGINIPISMEEDELLRSYNKIYINNLSDRERTIADTLVQKNILKRIKDSSGICLVSTNQKLRRD